MAHLPAGIFKVSFLADETFSIFQTPGRRAFFVFCFALLCSLPLGLSAYTIYNLNLCAVAVIGATGLYVLMGMTGLISLGHGMFLGVGAVTAGLLYMRLGAPMWITVPAAGVASAVIGTIVGLPALRLKGFYLALATLAGQYVLYFIMWNSTSICGSKGITMDPPVLFGMDLSAPRAYYYLLLFVVVVMFWMACNLKRSRVGRALQAIRDRDIAAEVIGVELWRYKLIAFCLSSFYAGVAGALLVHMLTLVPPTYFTIGLSVQYLAMIVVGGQTYIFGAILGSVFMTLLPIGLERILEVLPVAGLGLEIGSLAAGGLEICFGVIIILFLVFEPEGLAKIWRDLFLYFRLWPFGY